MRLAFALLVLSVLPASAQTLMTAAEFERYATGKTLTYAQDGVVFGTEQYLPNRRVRWAFSGGECIEGAWYEDAGLICFVYDSEPNPQCWSFMHDASGLHARFNGDPATTALSEVEQTTTPLICAGPDIGA